MVVVDLGEDVEELDDFVGAVREEVAVGVEDVVDDEAHVVGAPSISSSAASLLKKFSWMKSFMVGLLGVFALPRDFACCQLPSTTSRTLNDIRSETSVSFAGCPPPAVQLAAKWPSLPHLKHGRLCFSTAVFVQFLAM